MSRKVTVNLYMTLDGHAEFPTYPGSDVQQDVPDIAFREMWISRYDDVDTVIFGRRAFDDHYNFHSEKARKPSDPEFLFEFSRWLDRTEKVVLSHHMSSTDWQNSRVMNGQLSDVLSQLENEGGKDIIVDGGPSLVQEVIQRGLADDYRILAFPVILGRGKSYWGTMLNQQTMKLVSHESLECGELYLHYEAVR